MFGIRESLAFAAAIAAGAPTTFFRSCYWDCEAVISGIDFLTKVCVSSCRRYFSYISIYFIRAACFSLIFLMRLANFASLASSLYIRLLTDWLPKVTLGGA